MSNRRHFKKFVNTFGLNIENINAYAVYAEEDLMKTREFRMYTTDKKGIMLAPFELRKVIKSYFPFSFNKYLCKQGKEVFLTEEGMELLQGELSFPKLHKDIQSVEQFVHHTGLTAKGLEMLCKYYKLPITVNGCFELLNYNECLKYRLVSYYEKTPSMQYGKPPVKKGNVNVKCEPIDNGIGFILVEPKITKNKLLVRIEYTETRSVIEVSLSLEELKRKGALNLLHTGSTTEVKYSKLIICGLVEVEIIGSEVIS